MDEELDYLDYFAGGVPAGALYFMLSDSLLDLTKDSDDEDRLNPIAEVCLIGLLAHFEAFCKNHFASLINIHPPLVQSLKNKGHNVTVDASHVIALGTFSPNMVGFFLAEHYVFGTAKEINALYLDLLGLSPFSKEESRRYNELLNDRNLLVHHGGIYTARYAAQRVVKQPLGRVFYDSLVIRAEDFASGASFLQGIVLKIMRSTRERILEHIASASTSDRPELRKAVDALSWKL